MTLDPAAWATIVSIVASIVTLVGFAASIWFFTSGTKLQRDAQDALGRIESLAAAINDRTGENFSRLLDAVAGAKEKVAQVVPPGSPNSVKLQETFDDLSKKIRNEAAHLVAGRSLPRSQIRQPMDRDSFRQWLGQRRAKQENAQREIEELVAIMKEVGPLAPDELTKLTPHNLQDLEEDGVIEYVKGRWIPGKKWRSD